MVVNFVAAVPRLRGIEPTPVIVKRVPTREIPTVMVHDPTLMIHNRHLLQSFTCRFPKPATLRLLML